MSSFIVKRFLRVQDGGLDADGVVDGAILIFTRVLVPIGAMDFAVCKAVEAHW